MVSECYGYGTTGYPDEYENACLRSKILDLRVEVESLKLQLRMKDAELSKELEGG